MRKSLAETKCGIDPISPGDNPFDTRLSQITIILYSMGKISVLLADDHTLVRQGLKALLMAEPDMEVVGEAKNGQEAVALARKIQPEVVLMDLAMPMMNGLTATTQILRASPRTKVLLL